MLNETIDIDCDKEQLEDFDSYFSDCKNGTPLFFRTKVDEGRLVLVAWSPTGGWV